MKKKITDTEISDYRDSFMQPCRISGLGRQVRISNDTLRKITTILRIAGDDTATIGGFVENIIRHHLSTHADVLNAMLSNPPTLKITE
ncbi:DUF3408 domain-containing protein [uncultured Duncaniella sp.]|jgi:hypothetical protein|uniref:DUF3408 domain-containing protein n=1 Tax=uncultured Duncaniella sp. TaxID=2768039 RepID=UPI00272CF8E4|nr:DUF3408 domain-containing protein [uncultured Duncaniella sp.]